MHELYELKEKLIKELAEYAKGELSTGSLEIIDKLAHATKNICKVIEDIDGKSMYEGYSHRSYEGGSYEGSNRSYDGSYDMSNRSYEGSNRSYEGSYARGRGRYARRDSMGRYAAEGPELASELRELMKEAPEQSKQEFQRLIQKIEQM